MWCYSLTFSFVTSTFYTTQTFNLLRQRTFQECHRYLNRGSLVGGKQQGECLKVQWPVPTPTLSIIVNSNAYNFGLVSRKTSIFALA